MYGTLIRVRNKVNWRPHCTAYNCTAYIVRRTLYGVHCTAYIVRRTIVCPAISWLIQMPYMDIQVYVITL